MSKRTIKLLIVAAVIMVLSAVLVACQSAATATTQPPAPAPAPTCPATKEPTPCPTAAPAQPAVQAPNQEAWAKSPHNDTKAMAFNDWNETQDKMVPAACSQCHTTTGYQDFLGADGSAAGKVDKPQPIGQTITCDACHNDVASNLTSVQFLSTKDVEGKAQPVVISGLGAEARCMVCHQGRATKTQVDAQIAKFKATDDDAVVAPLKDGDKTTPFGFINVHYFAAAITLYGGEVHGGYEYDGKSYDQKFDHVPSMDTCVACHNPHTTEVRIDKCAECHEGVKTKDDLKNIRMVSSTRDYNGNGDLKEGMFFEIKGLQDILMKGIQSYAKDVAKAGIVYDAETYPYFLLDKDGDGKGDKDDKGNNIAFNAWTPRLLKAAYNYQVSIKDPGMYAHGNKYIVQLLVDSIEDLNTKLATKIDTSKITREDAGHFAGDTMPFRDWDAEGMVPGTCSKCHSAAGLPQFIKEGVTTSQPTVNGFQCSTCHDEANWPKIYALKDVTFPSGAKATFGENANANICLQCHQGRESTVSVQKALAAFKNPDEPSDKIRFRNIHYLGAGATLFGSTVQGMFQYPNKEYAGQFMHEGKLNNCLSCHDQHVLTPKVELCKGCHNTDDPGQIRMNSKEDYDGDGNVQEGLKGELEGYQAALYAGIQSYAKDVAKVGIVYDTTAYPYFFVDKDGDGKPDKDDKGANIGYNAWTPRLLEAGYNLQYSYKDPGAYVHNAHYVMQAMYDSLADLKTKVPTIDMSKMIRPK